MEQWINNGLKNYPLFLILFIHFFAFSFLIVTFKFNFPQFYLDSGLIFLHHIFVILLFQQKLITKEMKFYS